MRKLSVAALLGITLLSQAQEITNATFANWIINGIDQAPVGWTTSNDFSIPIGPAGVSVDSSGYDESPCAKISTTLIGFAAQPYAGFIVNGKMNVTGIRDVDSIFKAGEPFTGKPDALVGYYKFSSEALIEDWGHAFVILKKFNATTGSMDTVGFGSNTMLNPSVDWREFRVPITYYLEDVEPDSIVVAFFSTYPTSPLEGGKLWIDHLSFDYATGTDDPGKLEEITIYPNPVGEVLYIAGPVPKRLTVFNARGQILVSQEAINQLDTSSLPPGVYILEMDTGQQIICRRFLKNR